MSVLNRNIAALSLLQGLNYAAPLITVPYLVRVLGPEHFGLVAFSQALILYFGTLTDFGFNLSATRAVAIYRERPDVLARTYWSTMTAKALLLLGSAAALTLLLAVVPTLRATPGVFAASFTNVIGMTLLPVWLFQGLEEIALISLALALPRLLTIPALFLLVHRPEDYIISAAIQGSVPLVSTFLIGGYIWRRIGGRWYRPSSQDVRSVLQAGWPLFLSNSSLLFSTSSISVTLGFFAGNSQVGYFSAADKLVKAMTSVLSPLNQALYPHLSFLRLRSSELALRFIRRSLVPASLLGLVSSVATFSFAGPACRVVFGSGFESSIPVLKWLSPQPLLFGLVSLLGIQTLIVFRLDVVVCRIMIRCSVLTLPIAALLSWRYGAGGAAAASTVGALLMVLDMATTLHSRNLAVWKREPCQQPEAALK